MIIPIRCFSCGKPLAQVWEEYKERVDAGENPKEVMNSLGITRYCCKSVFLGQVELLESISKFKKF